MFLREIQEFRNSKTLTEDDIHERYFECTCCPNVSLVISSAYFGNTNPVLCTIKLYT